MNAARIGSLFLLAIGSPLAAQTPEWIWHDRQGAAPKESELRFFRKTFTIEGEVRKAELTATGDDRAVVFLNGKQVVATDEWKKPGSANVTGEIKSGENVIAIRGQNTASAAGVIAKLELSYRTGGRKETIVTDTSWLSSAEEAQGWRTAGFSTSAWARPASKGKLGAEPWGDVFAAATVRALATPADKLTVPPGFKVELLHSATKEEGSWICMTIDPKGRLIISPQGDKQPLLRVTLSPQGQVAKMEKIEQPVWTAMGLLHAFDSLYVCGNGGSGLGLYRLRDTDKDDQYDSLEFLRKIDGAAGEHGSHGIVLGPDKMLYQVHGNFVKVPPDIAATSPHRNYAEDQLLPRAPDGNGFGNNTPPPGGFVTRMDPDAKSVELWASGQRNTYDIAFNADGELFGFDSDMEWDWGTPWYRPIRINHFVSGGDNGFREGTGKWPNWYPDSLPTTVDIGIGSPTGVRFGTGAKFPGKYQRALYAMDWSYGRIVAVHLTPTGASYTGTFENFVVGKPLNVTDLEIGRDGAMYFTTGGRGTQSGLYRVSYTENYPMEKLAVDQSAAAARAVRRKLESFHGKEDAAAVDFLWPHLNSNDRWIRYAARIALESQPVAQWLQRALDETSVNGSLTALLALTRKGASVHQDMLLEALGKNWPDKLNEEQMLEALRVCALSLIRMGRPSDDTAKDVITSLAPLYPSASERLNRELCQLLIFLDAPGALKKTMDLLAKAPTQEEQIHYAFHLRNVKNGWTPELRRAYFSWFNRDRGQKDGGPTYHGGASYLLSRSDQHPEQTVKWFKDAGREYGDGASFPKFMANIKKDAVATLTDAERAELAPLIEVKAATAKPKAERAFVKEWKMDDLVPALDQVGRGRSFARGKEMYTVSQCAACHRFGNDGGAAGPDITGAASRFNRRDLLETIVDPSKIVSDQYQNVILTKKNGDKLVGRVLEETADKLIVITNPLTGEKAEITKSAVTKREASKISPMPEGLINTLTKDEILDLLAYIESGGKKDHASFSGK